MIDKKKFLVDIDSYCEWAMGMPSAVTGLNK